MHMYNAPDLLQRGCVHMKKRKRKEKFTLFSVTGASKAAARTYPYEDLYLQPTTQIV